VISKYFIKHFLQYRLFQERFCLDYELHSHASGSSDGLVLFSNTQQRQAKLLYFHALVLHSHSLTHTHTHTQTHTLNRK